MPVQLDPGPEQLLQFIYACPLGIAQIDAAGDIGVANPKVMQLLMPLGVARHGLNLFRTLGDYAPDLLALVRAFEAPHGEVLAGHRIHVGQVAPRRDGAPQVLSTTIVKLGPDRYVATLDDVSAQVAQERRLKQAELWFASLIDQAEGFAVIALDADGLITTLNAAARQLTGFAEAELAGQPLGVIDRPEPATATIASSEQIALARRDGWHLAETWCGKKNGDRLRCQRLICVHDLGGEGGVQSSGFTVVLRPAAAGAIDTDLLRRRLFTDHVTGVCNRAHFFELADAERRRFAQAGRAIGVVTMDIDHFKRVNDTHGHAAGDRMLQSVARACADSLRSGDTFARLGGEEFAALLPGADAGMVLVCAEAMRAATAAAVTRVGDLDLRATASFGCASGPAADTTIVELLERADKALYRAKRNGRNRIEHDSPEQAVA